VAFAILAASFTLSSCALAPYLARAPGLQPSHPLWIEIAKDSLKAAISEVDCVFINDAEIRQLTEESNLARAAAAATEQGLVDEYDEAVRSLPEQAAQLTTLREHHGLHVNALIHPSTATPTPRATASPVTGSTTAKNVLRSLITAERAAQGQHTIALAVASPELALLLASLAASAAANAAELTRK